MTFHDVEYVAWAHLRYGAVRIDLASSGIPYAPAAMLGPVAPDDITAPRAFADAIAERYGVPSTEVQPALGASQALWLACGAVLGPGDEALVETPGYEALHRIPESFGARIRRFERRREDGYAIDPARVEAALGQGTRLVLVSNLHNPSGARTPPETIAALATVCARRGALLLVDEVYLDLVPGAPTARLAGPNVIAISSLTKCFGVGWARAGWLLADPEIAQRTWGGMRQSAGWNGPTHAALGLAALRAIDALAARARDIVGDKLDLVDRFVRGQPRLSWSRPEAGLFGFVHVEGAPDLRPAIERMCDETGVLVAPGSFFGEPDAFRISAMRDPALVEEGLRTLAARLL